MNKLKSTIRSNYKHLTDTNKLISDVILNQDGEMKYNIATLASKSFCSNSAIIKYINYFGYDSYKIFVNELNKNPFD